MDESYFYDMQCVVCDVYLEPWNTSPASMGKHYCIDCEHKEGERK